MATTAQVNGIVTLMRQFADAAREVENLGRRITEAYDELGVLSYTQDEGNVDPATGLLMNMQSITPADAQGGAFLAAQFQAFLRGNLAGVVPDNRCADRATEVAG